MPPPRATEYFFDRPPSAVLYATELNASATAPLA
jgi:hypothetical protein